MLQVYSDNLTVDANTVFPFNNVVIDKGCVAEVGKHQELIDKGGIYSKLYNLK